MYSSIQDGLAKYAVDGRSNLLIVMAQGALVCLSATLWAGFGRGWGALSAGVCLGAAALLRPVKQESVMAIRGMGLQINSTGHIKGLSDSCVFIPYHDILDILINEVFIGLQVLPVMQIVRKDSLELDLAFKSLTPPLDDLQTAWKGLRHALIDEPVI